MNIRPKGTVVLPRRVFAGLTLLPWCREVNTALQQLRDRTFTVNATKSTTSSPGSSICQFGTITESGEDTVILGGLMICGDQNFNVADKVLALGTDGAWLVEISLASIEPAVDDDEEIFLPGVITSTGTPAWALNAFTGTEDYTSNTDPADATSTGTIIIPIGILRIVSGVATLAPTGCGTIRVTQCAGILDHTRG